MSVLSRTRAQTVTIVVILWLLIGVVAAFQRGYFGSADPTCSRLATTAVTVIAGPLNYVGVNPRIGCSVPQPSQ
jgi:membrane protein YdbS with pleckstrin-like domain